MKFRRWLIVLPVLIASAAAALVFWPRSDDFVTATPPVEIPAPPNDDEQFVGSARCQGCHKEVFERYSAHSMFHSAGTLQDLPLKLKKPVVVQLGEFYQYVVEPSPDGVRHHERIVDANGETLTDQSVEVAAYVGSGHLGHTFYDDRGGLLFETPISWYAEESLWNLSPGYTHIKNRFERPIVEECLTCHAGRVAIADRKRPNVFKSPALVEAGIGCERCHGPGRRHVDLMEGAAPTAGDLLIVSPQKLSAAEQESICYQCHLLTKKVLRYGRRHVDFRPGMTLDDVWAVVIPDPDEAPDDPNRSVSHVTQMWRSRCFQASEGRLGCTSCHDPHGTSKTVDKTEFFRQRCLNCHSQRGCGLDESTRRKTSPADSCVACHMPRKTTPDIPHASQTSHRIVRHPDQPEAGHQTTQQTKDRSGRPPREFRFYGETEKNLHPWELHRSRGLALDLGALKAGDAQNVELAAKHLEQALSLFDRDVEVLVQLAHLSALTGKDAAARRYVDRALRLSPEYEDALLLQSIIAYRAGDYAAALKSTADFQKLNPWLSETYVRKARMQTTFDDIPGAIESSETALELNPLLTKFRGELVRLYESQNKAEQADKHRELLRRIESVLPSKD